MSFNLRVMPGRRDGGTLSTSLKSAIEAWFERGGDYNALHRGVEIEIGTELCGYVRGLAYCNVEGAKALLAIIEEHDSASLWLEG